jgi:glycosyltransferase involved in cell wall biosynthesis
LPSRDLEPINSHLNQRPGVIVAAKILFELFNLTLPGGTGIATYARNLCASAHDLGYQTEGLLHSNRRLDAKDPVLAEISFFDARNRNVSAFDRYWTLNWRRAMGSPFGIKTTPMQKQGKVVIEQSRGGFRNLDRLLVAPLFMDFSRFHFKRYGRAAEISLTARPDIFHATQAIPLRVAGARNIYTIHDLVPLRLPYSTLDDKKFFLQMVRHLGRTSDRIVTVSEASRDDLIRICGIDPEKVVNTYQAVTFPDEILNQTKEETERLVKQLFDLEPGQYFLFYGALEPKKNVGRLIDGYLASGSKRKLIIAGGLGWEYDNDLAKIEASKTSTYKFDGSHIAPDERIRRLQHLPLLHLAALIRNARAVIFPSLYEGFGLPVIESMLLGTPVITSDSSALKEVAGDAARLVDPTDVRSIMAAIQELDSDDSLCRHLSDGGPARAALFSPQAHQERLARVYEQALEKPAPRL